MKVLAVPGLLLVLGSVVFLLGAAVGVPRVFSERDPAVRLQMLRSRPGAWRVAQPLYGAGPVLVAVGVGLLAFADPGDGLFAGFVGGAGCAAAIGAAFWARSLYLRATRVEDFAYGRLPGRSFAVYVLLTIVAIVALGAGLVVGGVGGSLGWWLAAAAFAFAVGYLRFRDIPPFLFYLVFLAAGVVMLL